MFPVIDASKKDRAGLRVVVSINLVVDICDSICPIRVALSLRIVEVRPRSHVGSVWFPVSSPPWLMGTQGLPTLNRVHQGHLSWDLPCDLKTYSVFKLETATEGWAKALSSERRVKCGSENWSCVYSGLQRYLLVLTEMSALPWLTSPVSLPISQLTLSLHPFPSKSYLLFGLS